MALIRPISNSGLQSLTLTFTGYEAGRVTGYLNSDTLSHFTKIKMTEADPSNLSWKYVARANGNYEPNGNSQTSLTLNQEYNISTLVSSSTPNLAFTTGSITLTSASHVTVELYN